jgi:hypothetical protein
VLPAEALEEIAYRAVSIQRLFARRAGDDPDPARLPVDLWGRVRLTEMQWAQLDLDAFRRRLAAERPAAGWDIAALEDRQNWRRIGIDDLWRPERS